MSFSPNVRLHKFLSKKSTREFVLSASSIQGAQGVFVGDGLVAYGRMLGFLDDEKFMSSFNHALERYENRQMVSVLQSIIWRKHSLLWAVRNALEIEGDFVECGVDYGFGVDVISDYIEFGSVEKTWYLYDTYSGVPDEQLDKGFVGSHDEMTVNQYSEVCGKFSHFKNITPVKGMLPGILNEVVPEKIAFLHIDLNNARGELETFFELYPRVVIGGYIIFDDYGAFLFAKQHLSERSVFNAMNLPVLELPTGQAIIIKTKEIDFSCLDIEMALNVYDDSFVVPTWPKVEEKTLNSDMEESIIEAITYFNNQMKNITYKFKSINCSSNAPDILDIMSDYEALKQVSLRYKKGVTSISYVTSVCSRDQRLARIKIQEYVDAVVALSDRQKKIVTSGKFNF